MSLSRTLSEPIFRIPSTPTDTRDRSLATCSADFLKLTNSLSQEYEISISKLFQKSEIPFIEIANVVDSLFDHQNSVGAESPGTPGVYIRIHSPAAKNLGMDQASTSDLEPAFHTADAAH